MIQKVLTVSAGKRLIGKAVAVHPLVKKALKAGTVVVVAGTTNGYVAEEILLSTGQIEGFSRSNFYRGATFPEYSVKKAGVPDLKGFPGDVVIFDGKWQKGKTIFDVAGSMKEGDVILKGANALDVVSGRAAVLVAHPEGGTIIAALQAVAGRRVSLIIPIGQEKRISGDLDQLCRKVNSGGVKGPRLLPVTGEILTELEAVSLLTGASAEIFAAGGVAGAEGALWIGVNGNKGQEEKFEKLAEEIISEPPFSL